MKWNSWCFLCFACSTPPQHRWWGDWTRSTKGSYRSWCRSTRRGTGKADQSAGVACLLRHWLALLQPANHRQRPHQYHRSAGYARPGGPRATRSRGPVPVHGMGEHPIKRNNLSELRHAALVESWCFAGCTRNHPSHQLPSSGQERGHGNGVPPWRGLGKSPIVQRLGPRMETLRTSQGDKCGTRLWGFHESWNFHGLDRDYSTYAWQTISLDACHVIANVIELN